MSGLHDGLAVRVARRIAELIGATAGWLVVGCIACAIGSGEDRYRLANADWGRGTAPIEAELRDRYPEYFAIVFDPDDTREPDLRPLRSDLEAVPVARCNYDALNALALGYFELNRRATANRGGPHFLADSLRSSTLVAVPWRAYGEIEDAALREAILDFFEDAGIGGKPGSAATAARLGPIVASLEKRERDPIRLERIRALSEMLLGLQAPFPLE